MQLSRVFTLISCTTSPWHVGRRYESINITSVSDEPTTTLISDITITRTTTVPRSPASLLLATQTTTIPQIGSTLQSLGPIGTISLSSIPEPISQNNYTFTSGRFAPEYTHILLSTTSSDGPTTTIIQDITITRATISSDEPTTTIIQDITITRTTTVPRSLSTMSRSASMPSGVTTWVIPPPPPRITLSTVSTLSTSTIRDVAVAVQLTASEVSRQSSDPPPFINPGYYGYYGFSRITIAEPTPAEPAVPTPAVPKLAVPKLAVPNLVVPTPAVPTSIVTSYVTATVFTALPGRCKD